MRRTQVEFHPASSSQFVHDFSRRLRMYGWWYNPITQEQLVVAHAIDALDRPYAVRERIMQALDLCTRMRLSERRVAGYGLAISFMLNILLFSGLPTMRWDIISDLSPVAAAIVDIFIRTALLLALYVLCSMIVSYSRWHRVELSSIHAEAKNFDDQDAATFRSDLSMIATVSQENQRIAWFLIRHLRTHRSR